MTALVWFLTGKKILRPMKAKLMSWRLKARWFKGAQLAPFSVHRLFVSTLCGDQHPFTANKHNLRGIEAKKNCLCEAMGHVPVVQQFRLSFLLMRGAAASPLCICTVWRLTSSNLKRDKQLRREKPRWRDQLGVQLRKGGQDSLRTSLCVPLKYTVHFRQQQPGDTAAHKSAKWKEAVLVNQHVLLFPAFKPSLPSHGTCQREAWLI